MPKIDRVTQEIFASESGNLGITEFGTAKNNIPTYTKDLSVIQNANFLNGWSKAILSDKAPYEEDSNGLYYLLTTQLAYLFQQGIPEYDAGTTYYIGSLAKVIDDSGDVTVYKSVVDDNTGNAVTNTLYWSVYMEENPTIQLATYEIALPTPTLSNNLLANEIWLEGQAVSRITYKSLFDIYGTTYGSGDGSTTFNLPNFIGRTLWGASDFGYLSAGLPALSGTATTTLSTTGNHNHTRGSMEITGWQTGIDGGASTPAAGGAMSVTGTWRNHGRGQYDSTHANFDFAASRSWTGSTSTTGNHTHTATTTLNFNNQGGIYGGNSTVQPPAIKCRVKTRWY